MIACEIRAHIHDTKSAAAAALFVLLPEGTLPVTASCSCRVATETRYQARAVWERSKRNVPVSRPAPAR
jgi:hypothetical protein